MVKRVALVAAVVAAARPAGADLTQCRVVDVQFTPASSKLQIVGWIEDAAGTYIDTIYLTQQTGLYGLGNRPGRFDFNSGPMWPYGRRTTVFPVWTHKHGVTFPEVEFQNDDDSNLSHPLDNSSIEKHYCRPMQDTGGDASSWDAGTCATNFVGTDKGVFSTTKTSLYPPRVDVILQQCAGAAPPCDSPSVATYAGMVPWDAVTAATPAAGALQDVAWTVPAQYPPGNYVAVIETNLEQDFNNSYSCTSTGGGHWAAPCTFPPPNVSFSPYGEPYRGQPSVVYRVPFTVGVSETISSIDTYGGYGDPAGADGTIRPPDATITTGTPGSGGSRLQLLSDGGTMYRVRVDAHAEVITMPPDPPTAIAAPSIDADKVTVTFVAPGDPQSPIKGYEIRVRANDPITDANFAQSTPVNASVVVVAPGQTQTLVVPGLLPATTYYIGVRAYDLCHNTSSVASVMAKTSAPKTGEVSACFVATAAYGSAMANEVESLRAFRDRVMRSTVIGELAIESYYTFGPPVAGVVGRSELLRDAARDLLAPLVRLVRASK
jgi:hypothetical protein